MAQPKVTIWLTKKSQPGCSTDVFFLVDKVQNTTEVLPGKTLEKDEVDSLISARHWTVNIGAGK